MTTTTTQWAELRRQAAHERETERELKKSAASQSKARGRRRLDRRKRLRVLED